MPRTETGKPCLSRSLLPSFSLYFQHLFEGETSIILLYSLAARDQNRLWVFSIFQQLVRPTSCFQKERQATDNYKTSYQWFQQDEIYLHNMYYGKMSLNRSKWKHFGGGGGGTPFQLPDNGPCTHSIIQHKDIPIQWNNVEHVQHLFFRMTEISSTELFITIQKKWKSWHTVA